jgi:gluconolactonase
VKRDGTLGKGALFYDATSSKDHGLPDGLKVNRLGNVWATGPGGVLVFDSAGHHLGPIKPDELPANVAFGDAGKTPYMTANTGNRFGLQVAGLMPGPRAARQ